MHVSTDTPSPLVAPIVTGLFDEDESYSTFRSHGTTDWLIICTLDGRGRFEYDGVERIAQRGEIFIIPPGVTHNYSTALDCKRWRFVWAHFVPLPNWSKLLTLLGSARGLIYLHVEHADRYGSIADSLLACNRYAASSSTFAKELAMNALELALIYCASESDGSRANIDERIAACANAICESLSEAWTVQSLARLANLSVSRFSRLFADHLKMTPQKYIESRRMERARQLLALSDLSVQDIATEIGYDNAFYFSNRFKAIFGVAPQHFRRMALRLAVP